MKITKKKDGRYQCNVYLGTDPVTGRKIQKTVSAKTKSGCKAKVNEILKNQDDVIRTIDAPRDMTVSKMCDIYYSEYTGHLRPATTKCVKSRINHDIKPYFGKMPLSKVTPIHVQSFINDLAEERAPGTVENIFHTLNMVFKLAVEVNYLPESPCRGIRLPKGKKNDLHPFDEDQLKVFLDHCPDDVYGDVMRLDAFTGLRESEIVALTWDRIDFESRTMLVDRSLGPKVSDPEFRPTKTGRGRIIPLPEVAIKILKHRRASQNEDRMRNRPYWENPEGLVFTTEIGRRIAQVKVWSVFNEVCKDCGFEGVRFHDLRHTYAVLSLRSGVDYKSLSEALGHATVAFTMDIYAYVTDKMREEHASKLDRFLADF